MVVSGAPTRTGAVRRSPPEIIREHHVGLAGRWRLSQGEHVVELGPGDYLAWDPTIPHDAECLGPTSGRHFIVYPRHRSSGAATS